MSVEECGSVKVGKTRDERGQKIKQEEETWRINPVSVTAETFKLTQKHDQPPRFRSGSKLILDLKNLNLHPREISDSHLLRFHRHIKCSFSFD